MLDLTLRGVDRRDPEAPTYEGRPLADPNEPVFDQGLAFDLTTLVARRNVLKLIGLAGASTALAACAPGATPTPSASPSAGGTSATVGATCVVIPEETAGPFPGDGSNGPDILAQSGVVRRDIRSSFGSSTTVAAGIPLEIRLRIVNVADGCVPYAGAAVYLWHCDQAGRYSMYSAGAEGENYLRGVQEAGADGLVTFASVFPACYQGRWPHIHFEVYPTLDLATDSANKVATSQVALPEDISTTVYRTSGYEQSVVNMAGLSLATDMVFRDDGAVHQLGTVTGSLEGGLTVELSVPVDLA